MWVDFLFCKYFLFPSLLIYKPDKTPLVDQFKKTKRKDKIQWTFMHPIKVGLSKIAGKFVNKTPKLNLKFAWLDFATRRPSGLSSRAIWLLCDRYRVARSLQLVVHALVVGSLLPENSTHHCRARLLSRPFPTATTVLLLVACWELRNERDVWLFGIHHQSSTEMFVVEKDQGGRSSSVHSGY